jgi:hypothetical protein
MTTFYDLKADLPGGEKYDFADLKDKVVLIVNTASAWCVIVPALPLCADQTISISVLGAFLGYHV